MSTPIIDAVQNCNFTVTFNIAGHAALPAVSSGGTPVDFTAGSWVFLVNLCPGNPTNFKGAATFTCTVTGDSAGILTVAWTGAQSQSASIDAMNMSLTLLASNDAGTTYQVTHRGSLIAANY